ncbi:hypothetical protein ACH5RR_041248 [Cinchona calisaya]|uniref:Uncharacterized protein n=1 Tax=Cinchona calisaya TaxID=153742 RepID=A0ABD2XT94_9GENT
MIRGKRQGTWKIHVKKQNSGDQKTEVQQIKLRRTEATLKQSQEAGDKIKRSKHQLMSECHELFGDTRCILNKNSVEAVLVLNHGFMSQKPRSHKVSSPAGPSKPKGLLCNQDPKPTTHHQLCDPTTNILFLIPVGMVILDEEFEDPTQFIVLEEEVVGITKMNHILLRKMLSGKELAGQYIEDIMLRKMKKPSDAAKGPFVLEATPPIADFSDEHSCSTYHLLT